MLLGCSRRIASNWSDTGSATNVPQPSLLPDPKDEIEEQNLLHRAMIASEDGRDVSEKSPRARPCLIFQSASASRSYPSARSHC